MDAKQGIFIMRALVKAALGQQDHAALLEARRILDEEEADDDPDPEAAGRKKRP
jgi:hypothetical protein